MGARLDQRSRITWTAVAIGLLLGTAGLNTESLYPPLTMHALLNLVATLEAA